MNNQSNSDVNSQRSLVDYIWLMLKGMAMGAADVVPGVSGGTVAFITGIYEELIHSLKSCRPRALVVLFKQGFKAFWKEINGNFLLPLLAGIALSMLSLVKVITWLMHNYPQVLWAMFFGLIVASSWILAKQIEKQNVKNWVFLVVGFALAWWICGLTPSDLTVTPVMVFAAGSIAICAMVLPGISGSFLLLIMGMYVPIIQAVDVRDWQTIIFFLSGCVIGLLSFVHLLSWLFHRFRQQTFAILVGFLLGSLRLLWPWKSYDLQAAIDQSEKVISFGSNLSPQAYEQIGYYPAYLPACGLAAIIGFLVVYLGEKFSDTKELNV